MSDEEAEDRRRYFGNKIQSHHVGRIGERVMALLIDLVTKTHDPAAATGLIFDDQHDVDAVFFFSGVATLGQIKASPLILLPAVVDLPDRLTAGNSPDTGLPLARANHTFVDLATAGHDIGFYLPLLDRTIALGPKTGIEWPYETFRAALDLTTTLDILRNWILIYRSFEIPKVLRTGDDIQRAWLTSGWGSPIDDNKTKAGLARSDNMMKGTYACLKYGAYYVQECKRKTLRTALISNIDPVHQYEEYLQKLEDIRWGHRSNFEVLPIVGGESQREAIESAKLTYLFDSVFTFNRQILNDETARSAWDLAEFGRKLIRDDFGALLAEWRATA